MEQIDEIERAYKAAKIPGPTPKHWLGKIKRMNDLGRPMPKGLEYLAGSSIYDRGEGQQCLCAPHEDQMG